MPAASSNATRRSRGRAVSLTLCGRRRGRCRTRPTPGGVEGRTLTRIAGDRCFRFRLSPRLGRQTDELGTRAGRSGRLARTITATETTHAMKRCRALCDSTFRPGGCGGSSTDRTWGTPGKHGFSIGGVSQVPDRRVHRDGPGCAVSALSPPVHPRRQLDLPCLTDHGNQSAGSQHAFIRLRTGQGSAARARTRLLAGLGRYRRIMDSGCLWTDWPPVVALVAQLRRLPCQERPRQTARDGDDEKGWAKGKLSVTSAPTRSPRRHLFISAGATGRCLPCHLFSLFAFFMPID